MGNMATLDRFYLILNNIEAITIFQKKKKTFFHKILFVIFSEFPM